VLTSRAVWMSELLRTQYGMGGLTVCVVWLLACAGLRWFVVVCVCLRVFLCIPVIVYTSSCLCSCCHVRAFLRMYEYDDNVRVYCLNVSVPAKKGSLPRCHRSREYTKLTCVVCNITHPPRLLSLLTSLLTSLSSVLVLSPSLLSSSRSEPESRS
jgi:hypothetical protein